MSKYQTMPIDAQEGTIVYFWQPSWGWPWDVESAKKLKLRRYKGYTVDGTIIHSTSTELYLKEFPDSVFNTVQFAIKS